MTIRLLALGETWSLFALRCFYDGKVYVDCQRIILGDDCDVEYGYHD